MASASSSSSTPTPSTSTSTANDVKEKESGESGEDATKQKKQGGDDDDSEKESDEKMFECNICLDTAKDAVVSYCGHLFCWPCLYQWLETRPNRQSCPVCKAAISRDKCIPLYGRGASGVDPRSKIPPRPPPTRTEQPDSGRFSWGGGNDGNGGFHMSFGIGAFPFGVFASAFNFGGPNPTPAGASFATRVQLEEQEFLSKVFVYVALIFIVWLLLA